jgi:uncharacterized membrane protein
MSLNIILIIILSIIAFLAGYFIKKNKITEKAKKVINVSESEDKERDKVIKEAEKEMKKNEEAIKKAESILNSNSNNE